jgi:SprT-like family protein
MAITNYTLAGGVAPTTQAYHELELTFDFFNGELFDGKLPPCLATLQRKGSNTYGYYSPARFATADGQTTAEIAINPRHIKNRSFAQVASTLVHEMAHHWQYVFGAPSRGGYHNREWAEKMLSLGLRPSRTGLREGPMTGQSMTHVIMPGGRFERAVEKLRLMLPAFTWFDANAAQLLPKGLEDLDLVAPPPTLSGRRTVYRCPTCCLRAESTSGAYLICGKCERQMDRVGLR